MKDQKKAIATLVKGFETRGTTSKKKVALKMLATLFAKYTFDLNAFICNYKLTNQQISKFLSYLLYAIYYDEILLDLLPKDSEFIEFFLLVLLAEVLQENELSSLLAAQSSKTHLELINYCVGHLREGAWSILDSFELVYKDQLTWLLFLKIFPTKNALYTLQKPRL